MTGKLDRAQSFKGESMSQNTLSADFGQQTDAKKVVAKPKEVVVLSVVLCLLNNGRWRALANGARGIRPRWAGEALAAGSWQSAGTVSSGYGTRFA